MNERGIEKCLDFRNEILDLKNIEIYVLRYNDASANMMSTSGGVNIFVL